MISPKILHIATAMSWRGGEQQVAYLLEELSEQTQAVVLCSENSGMQAFCVERQIQHIVQKKKGGFDLFYAKKIKEICVSYSIDLIHVHDAHAHTFAVLAATIFRNTTSIILSRRVDFPIKNNFFSRFKYNHPSIKRIICVSNTIAKITKKGIRQKDKVCTVYSGIDLKKFTLNSTRLRAELNLDKEVKLIGNTSALADHKDYFTFLDTVKMVSDVRSDIRVVILGAGPLELEIKNYCAELGLNELVHFAGFRTDVAEVLSSLDLFLITSKTEGLGTSILDAFACEVPVVATNGGGIKELVEHKKTGMLSEVKDVECLMRYVVEVLDDKDLKDTLVSNAKEKVQHFSKEVTAQQTLAVYSTVLR